MSRALTSSASVQESHKNVTYSLISDDTGWKNITDIDEHLSMPNLVSGKQTRTERFNGGSNAFDLGSVEPIFLPAPLARPRESFHVRQKWEGYVTEVGEETFSAKLLPIRGQESELEAEIYLEYVEQPDLDLVEPGAVFYWSIGDIIKPSGNTCRASQIRFRRLPPWTKQQIETARAKAEELMSLLDEE